MTKGNFTVRPMKRNEINMAIDWAETEGWNPGNYDADCFSAADENGFFLGLLDNVPVAMVSAVAYGQAYGFMGFYIVKPQLRQSGYGLKLWDVGLKYLGNRIIGLDSVRPDLVSLKKPDFKPAYTNFRFRWIKDRQRDIAPGIKSLGDIPWSTLTSYDYEVFTFEREYFLKCWITRPNTVALGIPNGDKLAAYGVIRECREGFKVGPLFADNVDLARNLFTALTRNVEIGASVYLDTPQVNKDALNLAEEYGMKEVFRTTRMYNKKEPTLPLRKWFGITSFELG